MNVEGQGGEENEKTESKDLPANRILNNNKIGCAEIFLHKVSLASNKNKMTYQSFISTEDVNFNFVSVMAGNDVK